MKRIAILVAVPQELAPLARRLSGRTPGPSGLFSTRSILGAVGSTSVLLAATGVGSRRSGRTAASVIQTWEPDLLVMAGVAGALSPELAVGDVVAAQSVRTEHSLFRPALTPASLAKHELHAVRTGSLLSLDRVLVTARDKRDAADDAFVDHPLAVEMETFGVIQAANLNQVPWAAVRAVSDTAEESLPLDFNRLRTPDGDLPTSRVVLAAMTRPTAIPGLIRLGKNTGIAAESLACFLGQWLDEMAES